MPLEFFSSHHCLSQAIRHGKHGAITVWLWIWSSSSLQANQHLPPFKLDVERLSVLPEGSPMALFVVLMLALFVIIRLAAAQRPSR